jgi:hypothetical protein
MASLFTYKIPDDWGHFPNPYGGFCALTVCKPKIRKAAQAGDWIAAFGCVPNSRYLIYAMRVDEITTTAKYKALCREQFSAKAPKCGTREYSDKLLVLLSRHFAYFGECAPELPADLHPIIPKVQGHRKGTNDEWRGAFIRWIESGGYISDQPHGKPAGKTTRPQPWAEKKAGR